MKTGNSLRHALGVKRLGVVEDAQHGVLAPSSRTALTRPSCATRRSVMSSPAMILRRETTEAIFSRLIAVLRCCSRGLRVDRTQDHQAVLQAVGVLEDLDRGRIDRELFELDQPRRPVFGLLRHRPSPAAPGKTSRPLSRPPALRIPSRDEVPAVGGESQGLCPNPRVT